MDGEEATRNQATEMKNNEVCKLFRNLWRGNGVTETMGSRDRGEIVVEATTSATYGTPSRKLATMASSTEFT